MAADEIIPTYRVFLSHSNQFSQDDDARAIKEILQDSQGFYCRVAYDGDEISSGQDVHNKISRLLANSDCVFLLLTPESAISLEIIEEITRANERFLPIIVGYDRAYDGEHILRHDDQGTQVPFPQKHYPTMTRLLLEARKMDSLYTIELDRVRASDFADDIRATLRRAVTSPAFIELSDTRRLIFDIRMLLSERIDMEQFQSEMMADVVDSITHEIRTVNGGSYGANIGPNRNYVIRATALFKRGTSVYAVSLDNVSKFWRDPDLSKEIRQYTRALGQRTTRLFVFNDSRSLNEHRDVLLGHAMAYGEEPHGAVLVCSRETYQILVEDFVTDPRHIPSLMREDFGIVRFNLEDGSSQEYGSLASNLGGWSSFDAGQSTPGASYTIEATLSSTNFQFREIPEGAYLAINHRILVGVLDHLAGRPSSLPRHIIERLDQLGESVWRVHEGDILSQDRWDAIVRQFPQADHSLLHLVLFRPDSDKVDKMAQALSETKYSLMQDLPESLRPHDIWIGKRLPADGAVNSTDSKVIVWHPDYTYLFASLFESSGQLFEYYVHEAHQRIRRRLYSFLDPQVDRITENYDRIAPDRSREALFNAMEVLMSEQLLRLDFEGEFIRGQLPDPQLAEHLLVEASRIRSDVALQQPSEQIVLNVAFSRSWMIGSTSRNWSRSIVRDLKERGRRSGLVEVRELSGESDYFPSGIDCLVVLGTADAMQDADVREELVRAHERGVFILPVVELETHATGGHMTRSNLKEWLNVKLADLQKASSSDVEEGRPAPQAWTERFVKDFEKMEGGGFGRPESLFPALLRDVNRIVVPFHPAKEVAIRLWSEFEDLLSRKDGSVVRTKRSVQWLVQEATALHSTGRIQAYKAALIRDLLKDVRAETRGITSGHYITDIGVERNFLKRAGQLFGNAIEVYAVSYDKVSGFWSMRHLQDQVEDYLRHQPVNTVRLFVFSSPDALIGYRSILEDHYRQYGDRANGGAVLLMSEQAYFQHLVPKLLDPSLAGPERDRVIERVSNYDFGVLKFDGATRDENKQSTIVARLGLSVLTFEDVNADEPMRDFVDPRAVVQILHDLAHSDYGFNTEFRVWHLGREPMSAEEIRHDTLPDEHWVKCLNCLFRNPSKELALLALSRVSKMEVSEVLRDAFDSIVSKRSAGSQPNDLFGDPWVGRQEEHLVVEPRHGGRLRTSLVEWPFMAFFGIGTLGPRDDGLDENGTRVREELFNQTIRQRLVRALRPLEFERMEEGGSTSVDVLFSAIRNEIPIAVFEGCDEYDAILDVNRRVGVLSQTRVKENPPS